MYALVLLWGKGVGQTKKASNSDPDYFCSPLKWLTSSCTLLYLSLSPSSFGNQFHGCPVDLLRPCRYPEFVRPVVPCECFFRIGQMFLSLETFCIDSCLTHALTAILWRCVVSLILPGLLIFVEVVCTVLPS